MKILYVFREKKVNMHSINRLRLLILLRFKLKNKQRLVLQVQRLLDKWEQMVLVILICPAEAEKDLIWQQ